MRARRSAPSPVDPPAIEETVEAAGARVPVRIFTPTDGRARGVYLDIHGGGFYMDSAARDDARNRELADALHIAVVSVDYRLAPEHPWPAAPDDCEAAALWLVGHADARFGSSRLAIGGRSAGATLALVTLLRLRDRGAVGGFTGAALQFGTYDSSAQTPAGRRIADEYFIQPTSATWKIAPLRTSLPSTATSTAFPRRCWSSGAMMCCWKTTSRWQVGSPPPAMTSSSGFIPSRPTGSPPTPRQWPGRRSPASIHGSSSGSPNRRTTRRPSVHGRTVTAGRQADV